MLSKHINCTLQQIYQIHINSNWTDCGLQNVTLCRSCVLGDCGHRSSQWSTPHWIYCEPHLPHTLTTSWGRVDISMERIYPLHISSCCKLQPALCYSHHWERPPLTQQDTTAGYTTGIKCLLQETLSSLYKVSCIYHIYFS